ncbi:MAG: hypothetical protein JW699_00845 [Chitinispirillaceae bacterium]|nr:hypothetical protein [Chitinispirillaceae bacterium]
MNEETTKIERLQQLIARTIARESKERLLLVGGFRYRLLDKSIRQSMDIDYHYTEDLEKTKEALLSLFQRRLLPEVKREFGMDGSALDRPDPEKSGFVQTIELSFYKQDERIEIPVDLMAMTILDKPQTRVTGGTVYLTASDADMVESKILALVSRIYLQDRDILDLFLFRNFLVSDSADRLRKKMKMLDIPQEGLEKLIESLQKNRSVHLKNIDKIIDERVDENMQSALRMNDGVVSLFDSVLEILKNYSNKSIKDRQ